MMISVLFVAAALAGQVEGDPREDLKLRPGEIVRYHRIGGRRIDGGLGDKVVITPRTIYVKSGRYSVGIALSAAHRKRLEDYLDPESVRALFASPNATKTWPSTYDGTDNVLVLKAGRTITRWNNRDFEYPSGPSLLTWLDELLTPRPR